MRRKKDTPRLVPQELRRFSKSSKARGGEVFDGSQQLLVGRGAHRPLAWGLKANPLKQRKRAVDRRCFERR